MKDWTIPGSNLVLSRDRALPSAASKIVQPERVNAIVYPEMTWEEFANSTTIRSGVEFIPFKPHPYQLLMSELFDKHRGFVGVKSRQLGISQMFISKALHQSTINPAFVSVFIAKNQDDSADFSKRMALMASSIAVETPRKSGSQIGLRNGATNFFRPCTENAARSLDSVSLLVFDEWGFVDIAEDLFSAAMPTQSVVGDAARTAVISTPNGMEGFYWDLLSSGNGDRKLLDEIERLRSRENKKGYEYWIDESGWVKFLLHWSAHPIYGQQEDYLERVRRKFKMPWQKVLQEFDLYFSTSASQVFDPRLIEAIEYWQPQRWSYYEQIVIGVDPAYGGEDAFCSRVWSLSHNEARLIDEVHERDRNRGIKRTGEMIEKYRPALKRVSVETNGGGTLVADRLEEKFLDVTFERIVTTSDRKIAMTDNLVYLLEDGIIKGDRASFDEYLSFRETKKGSVLRREAASNAHDDRVMADAIALWQTDDMLQLEQEETEFGW